MPKKIKKFDPLIIINQTKTKQKTPGKMTPQFQFILL